MLSAGENLNGPVKEDAGFPPLSLCAKIPWLCTESQRKKRANLDPGQVLSN